MSSDYINEVLNGTYKTSLGNNSTSTTNKKKKKEDDDYINQVLNGTYKSEMAQFTKMELPKTTVAVQKEKEKTWYESFFEGAKGLGSSLAFGVTEGIGALGTLISENAPYMLSNEIATKRDMADYEKTNNITTETKQQIIDKYIKEYGNIDKAASEIATLYIDKSEMLTNAGGLGKFQNPEKYEQLEKEVAELEYVRDLLQQTRGGKPFTDDVGDAMKAGLDWIGVGQFFDTFKEETSMPFDQVRELGQNTVGETAQEFAQEHSFVGGLAQSIGGLIPAMAATALTKNTAVGTAVFTASAKGSYYENYKEKGYTNREAENASTTMAAVELGTEFLGGWLGGINVFKSGALKDIAEKSGVQTVKALGIEGVEEATAELANIGIDLDLGEDVTLEEATKRIGTAFASGVALGAVMKGAGVAGSKAQALAQKINNNEQVTETELNEALEEVAEQNNTTVEALLENEITEIQQNTEQQDQTEQIINEYEQKSTDVVNKLNQKADEVLNKQETEKIEAPQAEISDVSNQSQQVIFPEVETAGNTTVEPNTAIEENIPIETAQNVSESEIIEENDTQSDLKKQNFTYQAQETDSDIKKVVYESASKVMNNTEAAHKFADVVAKLAEERNTTYKFTNSKQLNDMGYKVKKGTINGLVTENNEVLINVESKKMINAVLGHETTHLLEGTKEYEALKEIAIKFAKNNGEYQTRLDNLTELYKGKNADIEAELTADIVGDYLFTNEQFVQELSVQKPTLFQKIKNLINDLVVKFKGTEQEKQLRELQRKFEKAYKTQAEQTNTNTRYSLSTDYELSEEAKKQVSKYVNMSATQLDKEFSEAIENRNNMLQTYNELQKEYKQLQATDEFMTAIKSFDMEAPVMKKADEYAKKLRYYNSAYEKYKAQTDAINSILMGKETDTRSVEQIVKEAEKHFGVTTNFKETAYIDINGKQIDFSGKHEGGPSGVRTLDHRQINEIDTDMDSFIGMGNIRILPEGGGIDLAVEPNAKQYSKLREYIDSVNGEIYIDIDKTDGSYDNAEYRKGTSSSKIINDIKTYFETGQFPKQSDLAQFRYSLSRENEDITPIGDYQVTSEDIALEIAPVKEVAESKQETSKIAEPVQVEDDIAPVESEDKKQIQVYNAVRIDNKNANLDAEAKPHGLYLSNLYETDFNEFESPFTEDYENGERHNYKVEPKNPLVVKPLVLDNAKYKYRSGYMATMEADASLSALKELVGEQEFTKVSEMSKQELVEYLNNKYSQYDFSNYYDKAELLMAYGSVEARNQGYDAIITERSTDPDTADIDNEIVVLKNDILKTEAEATQEDIAPVKATQTTDDITIENEVNDFHSGETFSTMSAKVDGKVVGTLEYSEYEGKPSVKMVEVSPEYRRKGIGTKLLQELQKAYPDTEIDFGMLTDDGAKLIEKSTYTVENREIANKMARRDILQEKIDEYDKTIEESHENDTDLPEGYAADYNELYDELQDLDKELRGKKATKRLVRETPTAEEIDNIIKLKDEGGQKYAKAYYDAVDKYGSTEFYKAMNEGYARAKKQSETTQTEQVAEQVQEAVKPLQETVSELAEQVKKLTDQIENAALNNPTIAENVADTTLDQQVEGNNEPTEMEDTTPDFDDNQRDTSTVESPFENRDIKEVGNRKVKAYMYENPEVKPYFQEAANEMLGDLKRTTKGQRIYNPELAYEQGTADQNGAFGWVGMSRQTTDDIAYLIDNFGYTYAQIEEGLNKIIEDNGLENNAVSKRIEFMLDERLRNGYVDVSGAPMPANQDYINLLDEKQISEYNSNRFAEMTDEQLEQELARNTAETTPETNTDTLVEETTPDIPIVENAVETVTEAPVEEIVAPTLQVSEELAPTQETTDGVQQQWNEEGEIVDTETIEKKTKSEIQRQLIEDAGLVKESLDNAKDVSKIFMHNTDPIRLQEIIFGKELGGKINEAVFQTVKHNTAEKVRFQNKERDEIKELGIKPRSKESAAVQKYGEKQYVNEAGETVAYKDAELQAEFPDVETQDKIKHAAKVIRGKYDTYIDMVNAEITKYGYDAIPKRQDYMRHFQELNDVFSRYGLPFNMQSAQANDLPVDINGLTADLKPGKNWFASALRRKGNKTTYDAITGIDGYIEGIGNLIYHTKDIQTLRGFENYVRETYGEEHGFDNLDNLSDGEKAVRVQQIQNKHLGNYAAWLREYTNTLAGKKAMADRAIEDLFDRPVYSFLNELKSQVGSNMTGLNIGSALTNPISMTQALAKTNKLATVKGYADTIKNIFFKDNFAEQNDFLTARFGSDLLSPTVWQKMRNAGQIFMTGTDWFASNSITRSKFYELKAKGMSDAEAHKEAGIFAAKILGDRSQGATPTLYNSKMLGLVTQFQLEVNNQLYSQFYDTFADAKQTSKEKGVLKAAAGATFVLGQLAAFQYVYNNLYEAIAGRRPAFDIIAMIATALGLGGDEEEEKKPLGDRLYEAVDMLLDSLPYVSTFTGGGRIPISDALPISELISGTDQYGNEKSRLETLGEALPYYFLPTGYGQLKKTASGLGMYDDELPVAGSYTDSGNLRFTAEEDTWSKVQAGLFGQWANPNAKEYIDSEFKSINKENIDELKELGFDSKEYNKYKSGLNEIKNMELPEGEARAPHLFEYIESLNVTDKQKSTMLRNLLSEQEQKDVYDKLEMSSEDIIEYYDAKATISQLEAENVKDENKRAKVIDTILDADLTSEQKAYLYGKYYSSDKTLDKITSSGVDFNEYLKFTKETLDLENTEAKTEYLYNASLSDNTKTVLYETSVLSGFDDEEKYKDYKTAKAAEIDINSWLSYKKQEFKADKDRYGESISGTKKKKVINYINSLDLSIPQKALLIRTEYETFDDYNYDIVRYVDGLDTTYDAKVVILENIGFKVDSNGNISW